VPGYEVPWNNFNFAYQAYVSLERAEVERGPSQVGMTAATTKSGCLANPSSYRAPNCDWVGTTRPDIVLLDDWFRPGPTSPKEAIVSSFPRVRIAQRGVPDPSHGEAVPTVMRIANFNRENFDDRERRPRRCRRAWS